MQSLFADTPPEECCDKDDEPEPPEPPKEPVDESNSEVVVSVDPNEKVAPMGTGEKHYINHGDRLTYTVYFENKSDAKAPAQEVFIEDYLDSSLDYTTLRVESFSFGNVLVANPKESFVFNTRETILDYRADESKQWWVDMSNTFDGNTGLLKITFRTLDPETEDLPEDALAGFLPPENGTGRGQGYIVLSVETKKDLSPGTVIKNKASIVFDTNEPIVTNEAFNTIFEDISFTPFTTDAITGNSPFTVKFNTAGLTGESFEWDFGDGSDKVAGQTTEYTYKYGGIYTITLTVTHADGHKEPLTKTVTLTGDYQRGNADGRGGVDINDALLIAQYDVRLKTQSDLPGFSAADADKNGEVDIFDALKIAEFDAGLIQSLD